MELFRGFFICLFFFVGRTVRRCVVRSVPFHFDKKKYKIFGVAVERVFVATVELDFVSFFFLQEEQSGRGGHHQRERRAARAALDARLERSGGQRRPPVGRHVRLGRPVLRRRIRVHGNRLQKKHEKYITSTSPRHPNLT